MFSIQNPHDYFIRRAALLILTLVVLGTGFITFLHHSESNAQLIDLILPPIVSIVHLILLQHLYRNPDSLVQVLWINITSLLSAIAISAWYFTWQATFSADIKLIETLPPFSCFPLALIVTMFVFTRPKQVLITLVVSWLLIAFPILTYLTLHSDELFTPRGLEMMLTLGPTMTTVLVLILMYRSIEEKMALLESEHAQMQTLSERDPLTQAYNRRRMENALSDLATKNDLIFGLIMFDIDHFKKINDKYGHSIGDTVLRETVQRCKAILRKDDIFARWGGEEFLILIQGAGDKALYRIAEDLRIVISDEPIIPIEKVTASFGVTRFYPSDSVGTLLQRVDEAMYLAKQQGRNRVVTQWKEGDT